MSTSAIVAAGQPRRQNSAFVLVIWLAVAGLIGVQALVLLYLDWFNANLAQTSGNILLPSLWWRMIGTLLPLLLAAIGLVVQQRWLEGICNILAGLGLTLLIIFAPLCLLLAYLGGPRPVERARISTGGSVVLAVDEGMADIGFVLFEEADPGGLIWRRISELSYIQDGPYAARPELVAAPSGRWLLVRRAGIWTDAFLLVDGHPGQIDIRLPVAAHPLEEATFLRLRSERITALTGLRP